MRYGLALVLAFAGATIVALAIKNECDTAWAVLTGATPAADNTAQGGPSRPGQPH